MAAVAKIKIFPEEQIQLAGGLANISDATAPMWGVARVGDAMPKGYRKDITPANKIPTRVPRVPCQLVAIAFDNAGNKINEGDVKDGILYNGAELPNGNKVELKWSATLQNKKWRNPGEPYYYGDDRQPLQGFEETVVAGGTPSQWLGFVIDDTGLLIPGNDGILTIPANTPMGDTNVQFNASFNTDRCCDGFVKVDYAEIKPDATKTNQLPQVSLKAVIAQPDWLVEADTLNLSGVSAGGWNLP